jgi:hypothetical protein
MAAQESRGFDPSFSGTEPMMPDSALRSGHARRRRRMRWWLGELTILILAALFVIIFAEDLKRFYALRGLSSDDPAVQEQALRYLQIHRDDASALSSVARRLEAMDAEQFESAVRGLAAAQLWGPRFGSAWVRYLSEQIDDVSAEQRSQIVVEFASMIWMRRPHHDDPRIALAVRRLVKDDDPDVRLNALTAAACMPETARSELLQLAGDDEHEAVRARARRLQAILRGEEPEPVATSIFNESETVLRRLAELEQAATSSIDLPVTEDMPELIRIQAVRVSTSSRPEDLRRVFQSEHHAMRDLACVVALERFTPPQCRDLAVDLLASFQENQRRAGAILGGMTEPTPDDGELLRRLRLREDRTDSWVSLQHYRLALAMRGEGEPDFDPATLMLHDKMPRTTLIMVLLHMGRLEGADWLLNPLGIPPVGGAEGLRLLLDTYRYWPVLSRFFPQMPEFPLWATVEDQRARVEWLRDWYLVHRPHLRFHDGVFRTSEAVTLSP